MGKSVARRVQFCCVPGIIAHAYMYAIVPTTKEFSFSGYCLQYKSI
jgi:hypothetical protein